MRNLNLGFSQDRFSSRGWQIAAFVWLLSLVLIGIFWPQLPSQVPFFYSHPWGDEQLAAPVSLFLLPGGVLSMLLVNFLVARVFPDEKFLLRMLTATVTLCSLLAFLNLAKIFILVL